MYLHGTKYTYLTSNKSQTLLSYDFCVLFQTYLLKFLLFKKNLPGSPYNKSKTTIFFSEKWCCNSKFLSITHPHETFPPLYVITQRVYEKTRCSRDRFVKYKLVINIPRVFIWQRAAFTVQRWFLFLYYFRTINETSSTFLENDWSYFWCLIGFYYLWQKRNWKKKTEEVSVKDKMKLCVGCRSNRLLFHWKTFIFLCTSYAPRFHTQI